MDDFDVFDEEWIDGDGVVGIGGGGVDGVCVVF